jgi:ribosomal protein S18 acetylase RimI-like enzyme
VSIEIERRIDPPGEGEYAEAAWELKELIRRADGVLKQRRGFFVSAYRRARAYLFVADDEVVAFAVTRTDGYLLFLGVHPEYRGRGLAKRLVATALDDFGTVTCHARATNEDAIGFYEYLGFETLRRIEGYYEDGGDAYYLRIDGEEDDLLDRLAEIVRRR